VASTMLQFASQESEPQRGLVVQELKLWLRLYIRHYLTQT